MIDLASLPVYASPLSAAELLGFVTTTDPSTLLYLEQWHPHLLILRDFALERIADGTWNPKAQFPAHSLLAWAETRALAVVDSLDLQPQLKARWAAWIRKGLLPNPERAYEFNGTPGQITRAWIVYLARLHDFRHAHYAPCRLTGVALPPPEYPRPKGEILRELEAAEDAARWAHLMQLWTAHTGKTCSQSCQST